MFNEVIYFNDTKTLHIYTKSGHSAHDDMPSPSAVKVWEYIHLPELPAYNQFTLRVTIWVDWWFLLMLGQIVCAMYNT